jgi:hydrogenase maturation protease
VKSLVAGIGSTIRGDDGVGVHAVRQLKTRSLPDDVDVIELGTAGLALLDLVEGYDRLIVLDAIVTGAPAGTVHVLTGEEAARAVHLGAGHEADLPTTLSLGRKLMGSHMPQNVAVVAVEAGDLTTFSEHLTPEVKASVPDVIARVERLLEIG